MGFAQVDRGAERGPVRDGLSTSVDILEKECGGLHEMLTHLEQRLSMVLQSEQPPAEKMAGMVKQISTSQIRSRIDDSASSVAQARSRIESLLIRLDV